MPKKKGKRKRKRPAPNPVARPGRVEHPPPAEAIRQKQEDLGTRLAKRGDDDEISRLLSRSIKTSSVGDRALVQGALTEEEHARLRSLMSTAASGYGKELQAAVDRLRRLLAHVDGLTVLAQFVASNLIGAWGTYFEPTSHGSEAKVEFLAGLLLTTQQATDLERPSPQQMQAIIDGVDDVFDLAFLLSVSQSAAPGDDLADIRFSSKGHWLNVRGSSYEHHARDLAHAIFDDVADEMTERIGFNLDDMIALEAAVVAMIEEKFNTLLQLARATAREVGRDSEYVAAAKQQAPSISSDEIQQWLFLHVLDDGMTKALSFGPDELLSQDSTLAQPELSSMLDRFTLALGSLPEEDYISPLGPNPLTDRPFVRRDLDYMLPVPGMLAREFATLLERDVMGVLKRFSLRRARVLDRLAVDYLTRMLGTTDAHCGLYYPVVEDGIEKRVECDGLVRFDGLAIVVEGKASAYSAQARAGDIVRARRDLERGIEEAAAQGARAREYVLTGAGTFYDENGAQVLQIEPGSVERVLILNPTLHEMGAFSLHPNRLTALGLQGTEDFWSIFINDLRIVADIVRTPAEFLHYWLWRARLPLGSRIEAVDEIDVFATFLLREQFRELDQAPVGHVVVTGSSTHFDDYYLGQTGHGPPAKKPRMFTVPPVERFVRLLSTSRPDGWLEAAGICLDLSLEELAFVDVELKRMRVDDANSYWWGTVDRCTLVMLGGSFKWKDAWEEVRRASPAKRVVFADRRRGKGRIVWALGGSDTGQVHPSVLINGAD